MRAAVAPAEKGKWVVQDVSSPKPGPGQVLIKVQASGICYTDVHQSQGVLPGSFPRVLGHEPAGEIVALGEGVKTRRIGDRVGVPWLQASCGRCEWCLRGKPVIFCPQPVGTSGEAQGGHAEFMAAYADATMLIPDGVSYEQAAPVFCAGYTVWSGLRFADPKPHERVAVVGIGGLGHLAVQYAKAAGFETLAVTRSRDKEKLIRELGADEVVGDGEKLDAAGGADVILATTNSYQAMSDAVKGLRPDGRLVWMGISSESFTLSNDLIFKRGRIITSLQNHREHLYEALDYVAKGKVKVMTETFSLDDAPRAFEHVAEGRARFRVVMTP